MGYTAKEIDKMSIEEIEQLAEMLSADDLDRWADEGYSGEAFIKIYYK